MLLVFLIIVFVFFGNLSLILHMRFLKRLECEASHAFENAGYPSQINAFLPPGFRNKKYASWLHELDKKEIPASIKKLYHWSQVTWALAFATWLLGILFTFM